MQFLVLNYAIPRLRKIKNYAIPRLTYAIPRFKLCNSSFEKNKKVP